MTVLTKIVHHPNHLTKTLPAKVSLLVTGSLYCATKKETLERKAKLRLHPGTTFGFDWITSRSQCKREDPTSPQSKLLKWPTQRSTGQAASQANREQNKKTPMGRNRVRRTVGDLPNLQLQKRRIPLSRVPLPNLTAMSSRFIRNPPSQHNSNVPLTNCVCIWQENTTSVAIWLK